jgi:exopolysaccharide production protein ExoZ
MEKSHLEKILPYLSLDIWRGFAAVWVVMVHSCLAYLVDGNMNLIGNPIYAFSVWGQLGVVIFFLISGYCITGAAYAAILSGKSPLQFLVDRARRIYPPYLAAMLVTVVALASTTVLQRYHVLPPFNSTQVHFGEGVSYWLTNISLTQIPTGHSSFLLVAWSLCYEIVFYLIIAALLQLGKFISTTNGEIRLIILSIGIISITILSLTWLCLAPNLCPFPLNLWYQFGLGSMLFLLVVCFSNKTLPMFMKEIVFFSVAAAVVEVFLLGLRSMAGGGTPVLGHPSVSIQAFFTLGIFGILLVLWPFDRRLSDIRVLSPLFYLGIISYSIYLMHLIILPFVDAGFRKIGFHGTGYLAVFFIQIIVAVFSGWLFYYLVERHFISKRKLSQIEIETHKLNQGEAKAAPTGSGASRLSERASR